MKYSSLELVLALATVGSLWAGYHFHSQVRTQSEQFTQALAAEQEKSTKLQTELTEKTRQVNLLQAQVDFDSAKFQADSSNLTDLEGQLHKQRDLLESKRKEYQSLIDHPDVDPDTAAKIKVAEDELAQINQDLASVDSDISGTQNQGTEAKVIEGRDADLRLSQAESSLQTAEANLAKLKQDRKSIWKKDKYSLQQSSVAIDSAKQAVAQAKAEVANEKRSDGAEKKTLNQQTNGSIKILKQQKLELVKKREEKQREISSLESRKTAAAKFQNERNNLIKKLAGEIKQEENKLKSLEAQVSAQKPKISK